MHPGVLHLSPGGGNSSLLKRLPGAALAMRAFRFLRQRAIGTKLVEKRKVKQAKTRIAAAHFTTS